MSPLSDATKRLIQDGAWAESGDRTDPDDSSLDPPLVPADGWHSVFSADPASGGRTPRRRVVNETLNRVYAAIIDWVRFGIPPYDADVDTLQHGRKQVDGVEYRALVNVGPSYSNAISPTAVGQTVWEQVAGTLGTPTAPDAPMATSPRSGELDWFWTCPLDGGARVTEFGFQWRRVGTAAWSAEVSVTSPRAVVTGLLNGQAYEARVRAMNSEGWSGHGSVGNATPSGEVPAGGGQLALRATAGDGEVTVDWLEPDDGGVAITSYTVQWRTSGQSFSTGRQDTTTSRTFTRSFANDTEVFFQVRAVNNEGNGAWSNEASATPEAAPVVPTPDPDEEPDAPDDLEGTPRRPLRVTWAWGCPDQHGQPLSRYEFQWRYSGASWGSEGTELLQVGSFSHTVADTSLGVQARVRAVNSVGTGAWSSTVTVAAASLLGEVPQRHRFTSSQNWNWPYSDIDRAVLVMPTVPSGVRDASRDLPRTGVNWRSAFSDGTTVWQKQGGNFDRWAAYVASSLARDSAKDITPASTDGSRFAVNGFSDGTTIWLIASTTMYAYSASTQTRDSAKDFTATFSPQDGTSDGTTIWLVDSIANMAVAYSAATQARDTTKDIDLGPEPNSTQWRGAACNGTTLWFMSTHSSNGFGVLHAYNAATQARDTTRDILFLPEDQHGAASDGNTVWITSPQHGRAFTAPSLTTVTVDGTTYTSDDAGSALSGLNNGDTFEIAIGTDGTADIHPQYAAG